MDNHTEEAIPQERSPAKPDDRFGGANPFELVKEGVKGAAIIMQQIEANFPNGISEEEDKVKRIGMTPKQLVAICIGMITAVELYDEPLFEECSKEMRDGLEALRAEEAQKKLAAAEPGGSA